MSIRITAAVFLLFFPAALKGGGLFHKDYPILERYITTGLAGNLALSGERISYRQSLVKLKEARSYFLPSLGINARYTRAQGGRLIDIPVGDLVNPVHRTLNELLGEDRLPANIPNQRIPFLRREEHETRIRLVQQVFNLKTIHNYRMRSAEEEGALAGLTVFRRQLVKDIKTAYFTCLKTYNVITIYEESLKLLEENQRVTERLFESDKITKDAVYRARAELNGAKRRFHDAQNQRIRAESYLNFLLNRDLSERIETDGELLAASEAQVPVPEFSLEEYKEIAGRRRSEIEEIRRAVKTAEEAKDIAKSEFFPRLYVAADYGLQGAEYRVSGKDDYWMVSGILEWNIFNGFGDKARVQYAQLEKRKLETMADEVKKRIELEVEQRFFTMQNTGEMTGVASLTRREADESFRLMQKKYAAGMASQLEYLDAQAMKITAAIEETITKLDYLICLAELEEATALYDLPAGTEQAETF